MPRVKKALSVVPDRPVSESAPVEVADSNKIELGGWTYEVRPISDRDDDYAYDDAAEFLILAVPLATKIYGELLKLGTENSDLASQLADIDVEDTAQLASAAAGVVEFLSHLDTGALIREVSETLPALAAIACHYTNADVTARDVRNWAKTPLNHGMWRLVVAQMKAENIFSQLGNLQGLLGEFSTAATSESAPESA